MKVWLTLLKEFNHMFLKYSNIFTLTPKTSTVPQPEVPIVYIEVADAVHTSQARPYKKSSATRISKTLIYTLPNSFLNLVIKQLFTKSNSLSIPVFRLSIRASGFEQPLGYQVTFPTEFGSKAVKESKVKSTWLLLNFSSLLFMPLTSQFECEGTLQNCFLGITYWRILQCTEFSIMGRCYLAIRLCLFKRLLN